MALTRLKSFVSLEFIAPSRAASCLEAPSACCCCNCSWNKRNGSQKHQTYDTYDTEVHV